MGGFGGDLVFVVGDEFADFGDAAELHGAAGDAVGLDVALAAGVLGECGFEVGEGAAGEAAAVVVGGGQEVGLDLQGPGAEGGALEGGAGAAFGVMFMLFMEPQVLNTFLEELMHPRFGR